MKPKPYPTQEALLDIFNYDCISGHFYWKSNVVRSKMRPGQRAGRLSETGYRQITIHSKLYYEHRLAWIFVYGQEPAEQIDHVNADRSDNRIANLREASGSQNKQNSSCRSKSGLPKGVDIANRKRNFRLKRYSARIKIDGRLRHLGTFSSPEEAHASYMEAARKYFGKFARAS